MRQLTRRSLAALLVSASVALVGCPEKPRQPRTADGALPAPSLPATAASPRRATSDAPGDLVRRVADTPPGTTARAEAWRNGRRLAIGVSVAAAPRES